MTVLGLDVGGTKIAAALFRPDGEILRREQAVLGGRGGAEVGVLIRDVARRVLGAPAARSAPPRAIGAIVPGIYGSAKGRVWAPNIPGWEDYPLLEELRELAGPDVAVAIDSDRAGYILGETWLGAARGATNAIFVAVGTGIGAGILVGGRVLRGARDIAGATGWLALDRPYRPGYREVGCFEYNASGPGIVRVARDYLAETPSYAGALRQAGEALTTAMVFEAADAGDALATRVIDNAVAFWGMAVANYASLFDPEIVIFGGGVFGPAAKYLDRIRAEALVWGQPISTPQVRLAVSTLGGDAGLLGAGQLALRAIDSQPAGRG
jgi:glucokinase